MPKIAVNRRDLGALILVVSVFFIVCMIIWVEFIDIPTGEYSFPTTVIGFLFTLIGLAAGLYSGGPPYDGHKRNTTWGLPSGSIRCVLVIVCFFLLFFGPNFGERPLLFEVIAVSFGRSLRTDETQEVSV